MGDLISLMKRGNVLKNLKIRPEYKHICKVYSFNYLNLINRSDLANNSWYKNCSTQCKRYGTLEGDSWVSLGVSCYRELTMSMFEQNNASWITYNTLCRPNAAFTVGVSREAEKNMQQATMEVSSLSQCNTKYNEV